MEKNHWSGQEEHKIALAHLKDYDNFILLVSILQPVKPKRFMNITAENVLNVKVINELARNYNPLDYGAKLAQRLKTAYPLNDFDELSKFEIHKIFNKIILENYSGEQVFKYKLFQHYFSHRNIVAAFEIKVNNSRADFLTINGHTTCFEIKTALDNLSKFSKQAADYMLAFEYNYLIVDECHVEKAQHILPDSFGLWVYKNGKNKQIKKARLNNQINPEIQLGLLTKYEILKSYPEQEGNKKGILESFSVDIINSRFKKTLKNRYRNRWEFVVDNKDAILPIDLQFFFNTNILPKHIYYH